MEEPVHFRYPSRLNHSRHPLIDAPIDLGPWRGYPEHERAIRRWNRRSSLREWKADGLGHFYCANNASDVPGVDAPGRYRVDRGQPLVNEGRASIIHRQRLKLMAEA